ALLRKSETPLPLGLMPLGADADLQLRAMRLNLDTLRREMVGPVALTCSGAAEPGRGFSENPA
ncbi:hypothetical protein, partial [Methylobacterium sp. GC_Met_2]|uniref:hypothetical protein n=1 Tax=Methylobacterium sp. GC_Met_2 TaxID=2937376 RepID=UPI00226B94C6